MPNNHDAVLERPFDSLMAVTTTGIHLHLRRGIYSEPNLKFSYCDLEKAIAYLKEQYGVEATKIRIGLPKLKHDT